MKKLLELYAKTKMVSSSTPDLQKQIIQRLYKEKGITKQMADIIVANYGPTSLIHENSKVKEVIFWPNKSFKKRAKRLKEIIAIFKKLPLDSCEEFRNFMITNNYTSICAAFPKHRGSSLLGCFLLSSPKCTGISTLYPVCSVYEFVCHRKNYQTSTWRRRYCILKDVLLTIEQLESGN